MNYKEKIVKKLRFHFSQKISEVCARRIKNFELKNPFLIVGTEWRRNGGTSPRRLSPIAGKTVAQANRGPGR